MKNRPFSIILTVASCLMPLSCGEKSKAQSLRERFEAVYGFTDCTNVVIGTALTQAVWLTVFQTYADGYLDQKETTFLDENCKTSYTSLNRWATYQMLESSKSETGEIHLKIQTRRILASTSDYSPTEMPGIPSIACNAEMADDSDKEECKAYFDETQYVSRYVTLSLTAEGLKPFKDLDTAGTSSDTLSTELAPYTLKILDLLDK